MTITGGLDGYYFTRKFGGKLLAPPEPELWSDQLFSRTTGRLFPDRLDCAPAASLAI
jgi:hypothetical protein